MPVLLCPYPGQCIGEQRLGAEAYVDLFVFDDPYRRAPGDDLEFVETFVHPVNDEGTGPTVHDTLKEFAEFDRREPIRMTVAAVKTRGKQPNLSSDPNDGLDEGNEAGVSSWPQGQPVNTRCCAS